MAALLDQGAAMLARGDSALDVVTPMAEALEASGLHVAGKGAAPNAAGVVELDASIMDGATRSGGRGRRRCKASSRPCAWRAR